MKVSLFEEESGIPEKARDFILSPGFWLVQVLGLPAVFLYPSLEIILLSF